MPYFHLVKKILGVGTALVDVICQVDDDVISKLELSKGSMTLIEESQIQKIRSSFSNPLMTSGGSVCNTVHELNFGSHEASFYGKVNDDEYGNAFIKDLQKANILFQGIMKKNESDLNKNSKYYNINRIRNKIFVEYIGWSVDKLA